MKNIKIDISVIDVDFSIFNSLIKPEDIKSEVIRLLDKIIIRNKININRSPFKFGVIVNSKYCYNLFFKIGVQGIKDSGIDFFSPIVFSKSILNSITNSVNKHFNIRGYSNSYINTNMFNVILDFKFNPVNYLFFINIEKVSSNRNDIEVSIILFSKNINKSKIIIDRYLCFTTVKKINKFFEKNDIFIYNKKTLEKSIFIKHNISNSTFFYKFSFFMKQYLLNKNCINDKVGYIFKEEKKMFAYIFKKKRNNNE